LEIEEKNQFTATELATVIPLYNADIYQRLIASNGWVKQYFPNMKSRATDLSLNERPSFLKKILELTLSVLRVETILMKVTLHRWKRIYLSKYTSADFQIAFKTKKHASKNHPNQYQRKVMDLYTQKLGEFSTLHNMELQ
jgi:hypothetical protein